MVCWHIWMTPRLSTMCIRTLTGVLRQRLEMKLAATADGIARLEAVSQQTFPLVDAASPLTSQFKLKGEVHHCPLGWMSLTCQPDLSNVAFLIGSVLVLGIQFTIEQFLQWGGYRNLEVQRVWTMCCVMQVRWRGLSR